MDEGTPGMIPSVNVKTSVPTLLYILKLAACQGSQEVGSVPDRIYYFPEFSYFLCFVLGCAPPSRKKEVLSMLVATLTLMV